MYRQQQLIIITSKEKYYHKSLNWYLKIILE